MAKKVESIAELQKRLAARKKQLAKLVSARKKLQAQLKAVDRGITELKSGVALRGRGRPAKAKPGRPKGGGRKKTLKQAVAEVLGATRKALGTKDIIAALAGTGYVSKSKNLTTMVGSVLSRTPEFGRVSRGKYRLKRKPGRPPGKKAEAKTEAEATPKEG